jgi:hypothetical protein
MEPRALFSDSAIFLYVMAVVALRHRFSVHRLYFDEYLLYLPFDSEEEGCKTWEGNTRRQIPQDTSSILHMSHCELCSLLELWSASHD